LRHWLEGKKADGAHDVLWLRLDAAEMNDEDWNPPESRFLAYILAATENGNEPLFIVFNAAENGVEFTLPPWANVAGWSRLLDTAGHSVPAEENSAAPGTRLIASPIAILVFAGRP
jgi:glycogen operon protein